jgi:hypothetical protein
MPNYFWFLILAILMMGFFTTAIWKAQVSRPRLLIIFIVIAGLGYIFEYIIFVLFHSYDYYPKLHQNHWIDSAIGSIISQAITIPTLSMFIVAFHLKFLWTLMFTLFLMGTEVLFVQLGVYEHNWWRVSYTGALVLLAFNIVRWLSHNISIHNKYVKWVTIYLFVNLLNHSLSFVIHLITDGYDFTPGWFTNSTRDSLSLEALFWVIHAIIITFMAIRRLKWKWIFMLFLTDWGIFFLMVQVDLLKYRYYWNAFYMALLPIVNLLITRWVYTKLFKED